MGGQPHGFLLVDKPVGPSTFRVLGHVRRLVGVKRAGHAGTLDPQASGLILLCFGRATSFIEAAQLQDKSYRAVLQLGVTTDSGDREGSVLQTRPVAVDASRIAACLARFQGPQLQTPPMYSALKHQGKPLYVLARQGQQVPRTPRPITIYRLALEQWSAQDPATLVLQVDCSKGTYIRVLAEDVGEALGCGAHLQELRRLRIGHWSVDAAHTLESLQAMENRVGLLAPVADLLPSLPSINLQPQEVVRFKHGQKLPCSGTGTVRVFGHSDFLGTGELQAGWLLPRKVMA